MRHPERPATPELQKSVHQLAAMLELMLRTITEGGPNDVLAASVENIIGQSQDTLTALNAEPPNTWVAPYTRAPSPFEPSKYFAPDTVPTEWLES